MAALFALITNYGLMALKMLIVVVGGVCAHFLLQRSLDLLVHKRFLSEPLAMPLRGVVRGSMVVVVVLVCLQLVGVRVTSLWAALLTLAAMLAGGFVALSSVLSNLLCTALLLIFAPFRIGDEIEIIEATGGGQGLRGRVVNLNILYATIERQARDRAGSAVVYVPNTLFFQKTIRCWGGRHP
jgi:small-conductance mechanosensitive channel